MAIPNEGKSGVPDPLATADDVRRLYRTYLKRDPENEGAITGRLNTSLRVVEEQIRMSEEARLVRLAEERKRLLEAEDKRKEKQIPDVGRGDPHPEDLADRVKKIFDEVTGDLGSQALQKALDALNEVSKVRDEIQNEINEKINAATTAIGPAFNAIQRQIGELAQGLVPSTLSLVGAALGGVEVLLSTFLSSVSTLDEFKDSIASLFSEKQDEIGTFASAVGRDMFGLGMPDALHTLEEEAVPAIKPTLDAIANDPRLDPAIREIFRSMSATTAPAFLIPIAAFLAGIAGTTAFAWFRPEMRMFEQIVASDSPVEPLSLQDAAALAARGLTSEKDAKIYARKNGFGDTEFDRAVELQRTYVPAEMIVRARLRGEINEFGEARMLKALGMAEDQQDVLRSMAQLIPGPSDLVQMAVKEAFNDEFAREFTTDEEIPTEFIEWMEKQGFSREWSVRFWRQHWNLPSVSQGSEMVFRGLITEDQFKSLLKALDVAPFWRDRMLSILYNPARLVDIRNWFKQGVITEEEMRDLFKARGYSPIDADRAAAYTVSISGQERKREFRDATEGLRSTVLTGVLNGQISVSAARPYLLDLGEDENEIAAFADLTQLIRSERIRTRTVELLGDLYVKGRASRDEALLALSERGFEPDEIALRISEWDVERDLRAPAEKAERDRELTKTEIIDAFEEGVTNREETVRELVATGYDSLESERLVTLAEIRIKKQTDKENAEIVKNEVLRGKISEDKAYTDLAALGLRDTQIRAYLSSWFRQVEAKQFDIPLSSIQDGYKRGLLSVEATKAHLSSLGATQAEADFMLALWGEKKSEQDLRKARELENAARKGAVK